MLQVFGQIGKAFQFPSNGKAYPKRINQNYEDDDAITFPFPSNGKADPKFFHISMVLELTTTCFHSLQTGKRIQRHGCRTSKGYWKSFNCLQTGKRIQRLTLTTDFTKHTGVSIPFKRESGSKGWPWQPTSQSTQGFQFPSNGKADPKTGRRGFRLARKWSFNSLQTGKRIQSITTDCHGYLPVRVSIPFKRESGSKAHKKENTDETHEVSIPFKRESGSKVKKRTKMPIST